MRRSMVVACACAAFIAAAGAQAQQSAKIARLGWVGVGAADRRSPALEALRWGMRDLGHVEGKTFVLEQRWWDGRPAGLPALVEGLVRSKVDVLIAQGTAAVGAKDVTRVPVVVGYSGDPVAAGFARSLGRPGGNVTGATYMSVEINGKRLGLIKELLPAITRVAIISNPQHAGEPLEIDNSRSAAKHIGLRIHYLPVRSADELAAAFEAIREARDQAIIAVPDAVIGHFRAEIVEFEMERQIPVVSGWSIWVKSGALITYGPNLDESWRHLASQVDKVLKGAKPADLPFERPTRFELVVNLKTAKAVGIVIPQSILERTDEVIE